MKVIEDYLDFKLAKVFRTNEINSIPTRSTLNKKQSNIVGKVNYRPSNVLSLNYNFSMKNDLESLEYQFSRCGEFSFK